MSYRVSAFVMGHGPFGARPRDGDRRAPCASRSRTALASAVGLLAVAQPLAGCTTHQCDSATVSLGDGGTPLGSWRQSGGCEGGGGELIWQSSSFVEPWLPFPAARTYVLTFPPLPPLSGGASADPTSVAPFAWLALWPSCGGDDAEPSNYVQNGGQLAIFEPVPGESPLSALSVINPSCAHYCVRVEVRVPIVCPDAGAPSSDGGSDDGTGVADASDASLARISTATAMTDPLRL